VVFAQRAACIFDTQRNYTALIRAAVGGHSECVRILVDAGADKEVRDNFVRFNNDSLNLSLLCLVYHILHF
jgi:hypothetical protein